MALDTARHVRYFQRCYASILPHHYTANDSNRLSLGYLIVAALDLLSSPSSHTSPSATKPASSSLLPANDKPQIRKWVLSLRHPSGGFCGSPQHVFPEVFTTGLVSKTTLPTPNHTENANVAATYFALMLLGILAGDSDEDAKAIYLGVDRVATLEWLKKLQRPDGSFGEIVKEDGSIGGGRDMRYAYMASAIRWVLGGNAGDGSLDFDVDNLVSHIRRSQSFDGGIAESAMGESHAGYAYCAVAALSLLDLAAEDGERPYRYILAGIPDISALVHYLVSRQFAFAGQNEDEDDVENVTADDTPISDLATLSLDDLSITGFSGRLNKVPDTCYTWWVTGALRLLGGAFPGPTTVHSASGREFLLQKTQHVIGGFGKHAGKPPDVLHSYLGLAALATMAGEEQEAGLGLFDFRLCIGREAANRVKQGRNHVLERAAEAEAEADE
ncbi:terpenoid cyclases/protein prenyltransferase alpha-alpha toroid [Truncatella angustata]|uniref:Terpenoid cyclases/protein prenyltransferase alpha-alpha toroid n=1 Tax=Truncatella angustata TaxID=152316 RepID=A0A9P8USI9_9PEZI|nr:terpenoid cyclases/protein prenyltransferase alpha-alpha toroid [Truncatella angustata]KAH6657553.1 terpenoid cyclases/protein prenyltransferase alpha-alpha toroid [Truncatella angustata]KAH8201731.1 hypothetical protein TruAng_004083 [Truncatella angustata]